MPKYKNFLLKNIIDGRYNTIKWSEFSYMIQDIRDEEHRNILFISYITGLRPIEAKNIMRKDIEFEGRRYIKITIHTAKHGSNRIIWIPNINQITRDFEEIIKSMAFPKEYVFPSYAKIKNPRDKFIKENIKQNVGSYSDSGKFYPYSFYVFRHNILTLLAENGADFIDLHIFKGARLSKKLFGSVSYYLHHSSDRMKKISKILRKIMKE